MNGFSDFVSNLREASSKVLGMGSLMLVLVANMLFAMLQVYPAIRLHSELASQLAEARQALSAPAGDAQIEAALKARLTKMQTILDKQAGTFLAESEVSVVLNHLYGYADENGVQITKVEAADASRPAASKPAGHDAQAFQVVVSGPAVQLINFVARIKEAAQPAIVINQLVIQSGKAPQATSLLTMNLLLYTSPYAPASDAGANQP